MKRLPFRYKTSSFILSATKKYHINQFVNLKPKAVVMLNSALYVDDLYHGRNSVNEAFEFSLDDVSILKSGNFSLRKLRSNSRELEDLWMKSRLTVGEKVGSVISESEWIEAYKTKVLGLNWNPEKDMLKDRTGETSTPDY